MTVALILVIAVVVLVRLLTGNAPNGATRGFPVVAFGWLLLVTIVVLVVPGLAHRMSEAFRHLDESP